MSPGRFARTIAAVLFGAACTTAFGQQFPSKPVHLIVPFPAGGTGDLTARTVGQKLADLWKQPVVVENKPGGNTIIAADYVAKSAPDGYTLFEALDASVTMNQFLYSKLPYRPRDFVPITMLVEQPLLISAGPKLPQISNFKEFMAYDRAHPGKVNFAEGAIVTRVTAEMIKQAGNLTFTLVPYTGSRATLTAIMGGQVDVSMSDIGTFAKLIQSGKLRGLAVTGPKRAAALPDVPTLKEAGLPGVSVTSWFGLVAPRGTPAKLAAQLNADFTRVLKMPDVRERLLAVGLEVNPISQQAFASRIKAESRQWEKVIKTAGIKLD